MGMNDGQERTGQPDRLGDHNRNSNSFVSIDLGCNGRDLGFIVSALTWALAIVYLTLAFLGSAIVTEILIKIITLIKQAA